ncbi:MAG: mandelate racemase/muconate lactonizing enzyme family protein [Thermoproteota archaeon]|nr:mandelate racemase/muconate lactonizing enzyme family protein [Candidatus Brockarchaeota archaeon]
MVKDSDIRPVEISFEYTSHRLRTPLKFGSVIVEESTSLTVKTVVKNRNGKEAIGLGSMPLACEWAFPSIVETHERKLEAMKLVAERYGELLVKEAGSRFMHPIDWFVRHEDEIPGIARKVSSELGLKEGLPVLAALVAVSPIDSSLHDGFGKVNEICSYDGYGPKYVNHDLSFYLGEGFRNKYITDYIKPEYSSEIPVFHLVGGLDELKRGGTGLESTEGLPESLEEWIEKDGVFCFKIKLSGNDTDWDVKRTREVAEVVSETLGKQGKKDFYLSVDSNEMHPSPEAVLEYLRRVRREAPEAFERILYVEQPVSRDIERCMFDMSRVAEVKPVLADEGITGLRSFDLSMRLGWSGVALKTCKCQSSILLLVSKAEELGVPYSIQDLTCPGLAFVHSAGFAARTNPVMGVEYNARQYLPHAFKDVQERFQEVFNVKDGVIRTGCLNRTVGLGF